VTLKNFKASGISEISRDEFFRFLKSKKNILDGVCITGGEPTINPGIVEFCREIKDLGLKVKLDTNGSNPNVVKKLLDLNLLDRVAIDIKTRFQDYNPLSGPAASFGVVKKSINLIWLAKVPLEFRTTIVPRIHNKNVLKKVAGELVELAKESKIPKEKIVWFLQPFKPQNCLDPTFQEIKPFSQAELDTFLDVVRRILPQTQLRTNC
jgi:pyruvate formate lyase activating enzyme